MAAFHSGPSEKVDAISYTVKFVKDNTPYAGLNYQLGTFHTRGCRYV